MSPQAALDASTPEGRLAALGLCLPALQPAIGNFVGACASGNRLYLSGSGALVEGRPLYPGKVGAEVSLGEARECARLIALNHIALLKDHLGDLGRVRRIVKLLGMVASSPDFFQQPQVIDGCSDLLVQVFGERGRHARSAVGMAVLPMNIPVEIEMIVEFE